MLPEVGQWTQALMGNTPDSLCKWADEELQINQEGKPGDFCGDLMISDASPRFTSSPDWLGTKQSASNNLSNNLSIYLSMYIYYIYIIYINITPANELCGSYQDFITNTLHHVTSSHINEEETSHSRAVCFVQPPMPACALYYNIVQLYVMYIHVWYMRTYDSGRYVIPGDTRYCQVAPAGPRRASPTKSAGSDPDLAVFVCSPRSARTAGAKNDQLTAKSRPPSHPQNPCGEWART